MTDQHDIDSKLTLTDSRLGIDQAIDILEKFVHNDALSDMADLFGVEQLPQDLSERLAAIAEIATKHWDFRKGLERQAVDWNDRLIDQEGSQQWNRIFDAANALNMIDSSEPENKNPDYLVVLGGANRSPYDRLRFGLEQIDSFEHIAYLGSSRAVSDSEREKAKDYAPDAQTEFDLGCGAFESLLNATAVDQIIEVRNGDTWGMRLYEFEIDGQIKQGFVLSTPQMIGERRATTYDNYDFFAKRAELALNPNVTVVASTTALYVPGQHIPAVQELTLRYGTQVETIGHDANYSGTTRTASQLLQEMKSAVGAAVRLQVAIK